MDPTRFPKRRETRENVFEAFDERVRALFRSSSYEARQAQYLDGDSDSAEIAVQDPKALLVFSGYDALLPPSKIVFRLMLTPILSAVGKPDPTQLSPKHSPTSVSRNSATSSPNSCPIPTENFL